MDRLSRQIKKQIMQRFPVLAAEAKAMLAEKALSRRFGRMIGTESKKSGRRNREKKEETALVAVEPRKAEPRYAPQRFSLI